MKMNPPARSKSPISRKKPRIMSHPFLIAAPCAPLDAHRPYRGMRGNSTSSVPYLSFKTGVSPLKGASEGVDAAKPCLYKGANGGGRNPAAAFLWALPGQHQQASCANCLLPPHPEDAIE